jgi:CRP-like cAMP-binding protein
MDMPPANQDLNELYEPLSEELRQHLDRHTLRKTVPAGTRLIRDGVALEHLVIIDTGSSEIVAPILGKARPLAVVGSGKVLGLGYIVSGLVPDVDVVCLEECRITLIPRQEFIEALEQYPQIYFAVAKVLSSDLRIAYHLRQHALWSKD